MRPVKFISFFLALAIIVILPASLASADNPAATGRADSTGSLTVKVIDSQGAVVASARVALIVPRRHPKSSDSAPGTRPKPQVVAKGTTGADGICTFTNIPDGTYIVIAGLRGKGIGHQRVTISQTPSEVTLTLTPRKNKQ
jgi:hypothetical protein